MESDLGEAVGEVDGSKVSGEGPEVVECGKKDPLVRRHELLVDSGLAEVCCFYIVILLYFYSLYL